MSEIVDRSSKLEARIRNKRSSLVLAFYSMSFALIFALFFIAGNLGSAAACSNPSQLDWYTVGKVGENKSFYQEVSDETSVPWELLAAIHYRETGFSHTNPYNGQGIFQFVNGDGGPYPYGEVEDEEFIRQLTFMANRIQSDYVFRSDLPYTKRMLKKTNEDAYRIKDVLFSYNGRATVYADQATVYGFSSATEPYEGSPYVMNKFDCARQGMGMITRDFGSVDGTDTRFGAYTLYAELVGSSENSNTYNIVDASAFNASNIISDKVFFDKNSMTASEIQEFLAEQVPICDTDGLLYYSGNKQRKDVDSSNPPPYDCLKDYINSNTAQTAGEIIAEASQTHGINPQVILAYIETQNGLVTDDWPWTYQYQQAGCSGASIQSCYSVVGFKNQVNQLASTLKSISNPVNNNRYVAGQTYKIPFASGDSCRGSNLTIDNNATAAIYNYTGFQPNSAAIANPYGYGDSCSIHTNLTLWALFNNWFGDSAEDSNPTSSLSITQDLKITDSTPELGQNTTASFTIKNVSNKTITFDRIKLLVRDGDGIIRDFPGADNITLKPGKSYAYNKTKKFISTGEHKVWISTKIDGEWKKARTEGAYKKVNNTPIVVSSVLSITQDLKITDSTPELGQNTTASFTIKNVSNKTITFDRIKLLVRDGDGIIRDFPGADNITLKPGKSYAYNKTKKFISTGEHKVWISTKIDGEWKKARTEGAYKKVNNTPIVVSNSQQPEVWKVSDSSASYKVINSTSSVDGKKHIELSNKDDGYLYQKVDQKTKDNGFYNSGINLKSSSKNAESSGVIQVVFKTSDGKTNSTAYRYRVGGTKWQYLQLNFESKDIYSSIEFRIFPDKNSSPVLVDDLISRTIRYQNGSFEK